MVSKKASDVLMLILCGIRGVYPTKKRKKDPTPAQSGQRSQEADVFTQRSLFAPVTKVLTS